MYVCICKAVTDHEIREAAETGVDNLDKLAEALGAGTGCGCCRETAQQIIEQHSHHARGELLYHTA